MKKAAVYARSSSLSESQNQINKCKELVPDYIVEEYSDIGPADMECPSRDQLCKDVKTGCFEVVAIYSPDRLARNLDDLLMFKEEIKQSGARLVFAC